VGEFVFRRYESWRLGFGLELILDDIKVRGVLVLDLWNEEMPAGFFWRAFLIQQVSGALSSLGRAK
jgi:hypothetical protein